MYKFSFPAPQSGQTLIETLVAVFMLVMGITAALGLAIYALNSSTNISKQIIAAGLAREGIEAVKDMRDTNWLQQGTGNIDKTCYDYFSGSNDANCYTHWLDQTFCLNPSNGGSCNGSQGSASYFLSFDYTTSNFWIFNKTTSSKYGLQFSATGNSMGFYNTKDNNGLSCANGSNMSDYCRKIVITKDTTVPYNQNEGPLLKVQSFVWWVDKKCPRVSDYSSANSSCRVEIDSYFTNWKNY